MPSPGDCEIVGPRPQRAARQLFLTRIHAQTFCDPVRRAAGRQRRLRRTGRARRATGHAEKPKLLQTLKSLVDIESGSTNRAGLDKLSTLIGERLKALGGEVQYIEPAAADV